MALRTDALNPLLLLILAVIIHPSCGAKHLNGEALVEEICRRTSSHEYCVGTMIPGPPLTVEGIASTAFGWAQKKALEAGTIISSLLKGSSSTANHGRYQVPLQRCWALNMEAMADLWSAGGSFYSKNIKAIVNYLYGVSWDTKRCETLKSGRNLTSLAAKNYDIIKLSEICVDSTKFF